MTRPPHDWPLLVMEDISKSFDDVRVLDGADLWVRSGRLVSLRGANGVGKTTLLRIASGLLNAESGRISFGGLTPDGKTRAFYHHVSFLSAGNTGLYARLSVRRNLEFVAGLRLIPGTRRREVVDTALRRFGLLELEDRRVDRLSMGQRQRVRLSITFLDDPLVVLLDEPRTSLDDQGVQLLVAAIEELRSHGGAALWCSPGGDDAVLPTADCLVLEHGKVKAC